MAALAMARKGRVVGTRNGSFAFMEAAARGGMNKGAFIVRGAHSQEEQIALWLQGKQEEHGGSFEQVIVGPLRHGGHGHAPPPPPRHGHGHGHGHAAHGHDNSDGCGSEECKDPSCSGGTKTVGGLAEVKAACERLVARLPESFRDAVREDAEALAAMSMRLCPKAPVLSLRLQVIQHNVGLGRAHFERRATS